MRNKRRLIPIIAAFHFMVSAAIVFAAFALFFNDNKSEELRAIRQALTQIGEILLFPLFPQNLNWFLPRFGWYGIPVLMIANSFLWAVVLYSSMALLMRIKNRGKRPIPAPLSLFCFFALFSVGVSASAQNPTTEQTKLLPTLKRMPKEFAPEIRKISLPEKRHPIGV